MHSFKRAAALALAFSMVGCAALHNWWAGDPCSRSEVEAGVLFVWGEVLNVLQAPERPSVGQEVIHAVSNLPASIQAVVAECATIRAAAEAQAAHAAEAADAGVHGDAPALPDKHVNVIANARAVLAK